MWRSMEGYGNFMKRLITPFEVINLVITVACGLSHTHNYGWDNGSPAIFVYFFFPFESMVLAFYYVVIPST
jgi:hypothetical protein